MCDEIQPSSQCDMLTYAKKLWDGKWFRLYEAGGARTAPGAPLSSVGLLKNVALTRCMRLEGHLGTLYGDPSGFPVRKRLLLAGFDPWPADALAAPEAALLQAMPPSIQPSAMPPARQHATVIYDSQTTSKPVYLCLLPGKTQHNSSSMIMGAELSIKDSIRSFSIAAIMISLLLTPR